jgi:hypothetical protein
MKQCHEVSFEEASVTTYGSSSNASPGIWLAVILGGVLVVFALTALIVSILILG